MYHSSGSERSDHFLRSDLLYLSDLKEVAGCSYFWLILSALPSSSSRPHSEPLPRPVDARILQPQWDQRTGEICHAGQSPSATGRHKQSAEPWLHQQLCAMQSTCLHFCLAARLKKTTPPRSVRSPVVLDLHWANQLAVVLNVMSQSCGQACGVLAYKTHLLKQCFPEWGETVHLRRPQPCFLREASCRPLWSVGGGWASSEGGRLFGLRLIQDGRGLAINTFFGDRLSGC